eukprot:CAMPEP_0205849794 /NCGR_PEP_ID=MMETSP1019-20131125/32212_1 /ASSEMBLY_ACC=CAM_ASM_000403 /TAXON_ID=46462 /ORGANISM="Anophryoides haemophila, Strain AH6" /LENGTH=43 /DNA_ID= /DNA_START= /DNA_END= /DNA_ORIENTATION=
MNHTEFDFTEDLAIPVYNFLNGNGIDIDLKFEDYDEPHETLFP